MKLILGRDFRVEKWHITKEINSETVFVYYLLFILLSPFFSSFFFFVVLFFFFLFVLLFTGFHLFSISS